MDGASLYSHAFGVNTWNMLTGGQFVTIVEDDRNLLVFFLLK